MGPSRSMELTPEARNALWEQYERERTTALRDALVDAYFPLLFEAVEEMEVELDAPPAWEELVTDAMPGLLAAVESFDPAAGFPFEPYGRVHLLSAMRWADREGRERPVSVRKRIERMHADAKELARLLGRDPLNDELAQRLGVAPADLDAIRAAQRVFHSDYAEEKRVSAG